MYIKFSNEGNSPSKRFKKPSSRPKISPNNIEYFVTAQSAEAVEYSDCISTEGKDSPNEFPVYDN